MDSTDPQDQLLIWKLGVGEYDAETFTAEDNGDGGTGVLTGQPYVFYKDNMAEWVDKL